MIFKITYLFLILSGLICSADELAVHQNCSTNLKLVSAEKSIEKLASNWNVRNFKYPYLVDLSYEKFGFVGEKDVQLIKDFIEKNQNNLGEKLILFRGQKTVTKLSRIPIPPKNVEDFISMEFMMGVDKIVRMFNENRKAETLSHISEGSHKMWQVDDALYREATLLDGLAILHRSSGGSPILISASRSLGVAAGDYVMRITDNRNRYIYVLDCPKNSLVNVYGMLADRTLKRQKSENGFSSITKLEKDPLAEREAAVFLNADPFILGIYDTQSKSFVTIDTK